MQKVTSKDGTAIAFDKTGHGPALILVSGALGDRFAALALTPLLSPHFTVLAYDRRGRGDSGDTAPYAVEREVEDIIVAQMRQSPMWAGMEKLAHTLAYDGKIMGKNMAGHSLQASQWLPSRYLCL